MAEKDIKPININPELFKISSAQFTNKAKTLKRNKSKINPTNLKKELLEKIKRKSRRPKITEPDDLDSSFNMVSKPQDSIVYGDSVIKNEDNPVTKKLDKTSTSNPPISVVLGKNQENINLDKDDDFLQSIEYLKNLSKKREKKFKKKDDLSENFPIITDKHEKILDSSNNKNLQPKFGCLKGGTLPTFRQFHNKTVKYNSDSENLLNKGHSKTIKYNLGKKGKYISVLVKNRDSRKKILEECNRLKETNLIDMKNYLKRHNFLKSGSNAPAEIIKKMYEQCLLAGDIRNLNNKSFIQNYLAN